jgi:hypothetical protein
MAEPPRAPPDAGDEAKAEAPETKGESDPLFNPIGLKRRTTVMGLAPAPHLGGLSGSPGAQARAEEEARKARVAARLNSTRPQPLAPVVTVPPVAQRPMHEELTEPLPRPFGGSGTGPPPAADAQSEIPQRPNKTPIFLGPPPPAIAQSMAPVPNAGTTTLLMSPPTPQVPLTLPKKTISDELPEAAGWDFENTPKDPESEPGLPSAPTIVVEQPTGAQIGSGSSRPPPKAQSQSQQQQPQPQPRRSLDATAHHAKFAADHRADDASGSVARKRNAGDDAVHRPGSTERDSVDGARDSSVRAATVTTTALRLGSARQTARASQRAGLCTRCRLSKLA